MSSKQPSNRLSDENSVPKSISDQLKDILVDNLPTIGVAVLLAVGVRWLVAEPRYIPSSSMEPTLQIDDRLIIEKLSYYFRKPARGEIIVFNPPPNPAVDDTSKVYIKRVIGLPGDRISIQNGKVYVNRQALKEPYIAQPPQYDLPSQDPVQCPNCFQPSTIIQDGNLPSFTVPPGKYWVMGDNRNNSQDSHVWGFLPQENIVGRAYVRYWPFDKRTGELVTPQY
jgi:signal peptidase I